MGVGRVRNGKSGSQGKQRRQMDKIAKTRQAGLQAEPVSHPEGKRRRLAEQGSKQGT
jgi:hypothetical protein